MKVFIPQTLQSYTHGCAHVEASGATLDEVLHDLDRQFAGIRFRMVNEQDEIRPHVVMFVRSEKTKDLQTRVGDEEIVIMQALSGG